ncbi:DNA-directed RNA polymerase subunit beta [Nocardia cyriacigeorgica]|uniref:DNA-directed RNA polymerase subunit beta n=1 Tax=Nocardia cyriacigeorgica TaxID=135487 RepID=UPI002454ABF2|nr:DNA-directed RNA polymerase subunit beta [Nocardia cyriacigeorgica]
MSVIAPGRALPSTPRTPKVLAMEHVPSGDTPRTRCRYYRDVCGLPAWIHPTELGRVVLPAEQVWALMMPSALGLAVKSDLERCRNHDVGIGAGPIISHVRSGRWSFLVEPDIPDETALFAEMFRLNVSIVRTGATIALPSPSDPGELFRRWIHLPPCTIRPSGLAVIDSIRACTARTSWRSIPTYVPVR